MATKKTDARSLGPPRDLFNAMECRDCEDFLERGIHAFESLIRADRHFRRAVADGSLEYDPKLEHALEELFRGWLAPCKDAHAWIDRLQPRFEIDNLEQFKQCEAEVRAIVQHLDNDCLTEPMAQLRDAAIEEHRNEETAGSI